MKDTRLVKQYEASARYRCKMRASGMVQIQVWVPEAQAQDVRDYAERLRSKS